MRSDNPGFVPDSPFSKQLPEEWLNFFKTFPKLELHCHLLGTTSKETFEELVAESGADVSQEEINNFYTRGDKPVGVLRIFRCLDVNFQRFPTLDAKKLVNAPKMSAHHRGICHF